MDKWQIHNGDCLEVMKTLKECSIDSVVCDPPYCLTSISSRFKNTSKEDNNKTGERAKNRSDGYARLSGGFMGQVWDHDIAFNMHTWEEVFRVMKPGAHLLAFGGTRTFHRMTCAIEDAGFEIRDCLMWLYGSGFPKSHDVSKDIDKKAGVKRKVSGRRMHPTLKDTSLIEESANAAHGDNVWAREWDITDPSTLEAQQWSGWGSALKPAWEPIIMAQKPFKGTIAGNVLEYGTGAINIDGCRIGTDERFNPSAMPNQIYGQFCGDETSGRHTIGRWPANLLLDEEIHGMFPHPNKSSGEPYLYSDKEYDVQGFINKIKPNSPSNYNDTGSVARFFYSSKASAKDRIYTCTICNCSIFKSEFPFHKHDQEKFNHIATHPTCKPVSLMRYLVRLVTPPDGLILDPFAGSGTTLQAAVEEGFNVIGVEKEVAYVQNIEYRMNNIKQQSSLESFLE